MVLTSLSFLAEGQPWPPRGEAARINGYKENIALRSNDFSIWEDLTRYLREDQKKELSLYFGYFWMFTRSESSLLWGTAPDITGKNDAETAALSDLMQSTDIQRVRKEVGYDVSGLGSGLFKLYKDDAGNVKIQANIPAIWFPVFLDGNIREVQYHVLATRFEADDGDKPRAFLRIEIHSKNWIEHQVWELNSGGLGKQRDLNQFFPDIAKRTRSGVEENPTGEFLVIPVHNIRKSNEAFGESDYSPDLKACLRAICEAYAQRQVVLKKHVDPNIVAPRGAFKEWDPVQQKSIARAGGRLIEYKHDPGMTAPDIFYLESANLAANVAALQQEIKDLKQEFQALSGLPPQYFSQELAGSAESGTALFYKCQNLLARVDDLKEEFDTALVDVLRVATKLQGKEIVSSVKWHTGLKMPPLEVAQKVAVLASTMLFRSKEGQKALIMEAGFDAEAAQKIVDAAESESNQGELF